MEQAAKLKERFEINAENSLFMDDATQKNVPMDGMPVFVSQSWDTIRNQKELNLPDQREMVANYRCNELKEEALQAVKPQVDALEKTCMQEVCADFK